MCTRSTKTAESVIVVVDREVAVGKLGVAAPTGPLRSIANWPIPVEQSVEIAFQFGPRIIIEGDANEMQILVVPIAEAAVCDTRVREVREQAAVVAEFDCLFVITFGGTPHEPRHLGSRPVVLVNSTVASG